MALVDVRGREGRAPPRGGPNSFNVMTFLGIFDKIVVDTPPPWRVGAPTAGKSWIRHLKFSQNFLSQSTTKTRMHSSRIHTVHSSSHLSRGRFASVHAGITTPPPRTRHPPGTRPPEEQTHPRDQAPSARSRPPPRTRHHPQSRPPPGADTPPGTRPPPPRGQTHACGNITFATLLRTVKMFS